MPKQTERERLADLEARQMRIMQEIDAARRAVRGKYAEMIRTHPVEHITERAFREILVHIVRVGGDASLAALQALPPAESVLPKPPAKGVPAASTAEPRAAGRDQPG